MPRPTHTNPPRDSGLPRPGSPVTAPTTLPASPRAWTWLAEESVTAQPRKEMASPGLKARQGAREGWGEGTGAKKPPGKHPCTWDFLPVLRPWGPWYSHPQKQLLVLLCQVGLRGPRTLVCDPAVLSATPAHYPSPGLAGTAGSHALLQPCGVSLPHAQPLHFPPHFPPTPGLHPSSASH